jgi:hypothetical protein
MSTRARKAGGVHSKADDTSVRLGIHLWDTYGGSLTLSSLHAGVASTMNVWRTEETYQVNAELHD